MAKKTVKTQSELSRVEWLKTGISLKMSYSKGEVCELNANLANELSEAGYVKVIEAPATDATQSTDATFEDVDSDVQP